MAQEYAITDKESSVKERAIDLKGVEIEVNSFMWPAQAVTTTIKL